jgi:hypothetical protein
MGASIFAWLIQEPTTYHFWQMQDNGTRVSILENTRQKREPGAFADPPDPL